ncbi:MAG TPA: hypothetical protein VEK37_10755, partial [Gemmatimonadaceae bacterium]|nr:hypothetical protein [Gemmatimonadaceae bacterium]
MADAHRICKHRVEYRFQRARGAADYAQHFGRRRLLLQGFPQLVQQPGVLNRDDSLARKVRHQRDLLVGE